MKRKFNFTSFLLLISLFTNAQGRGGIYLNVSGYKTHTLSYETPCNQSKNKIRIHNIFGYGAAVTVIKDGEKHILRKKDLYGYVDCNNATYRFYLNTEYRIVDAGNIYIYTQEEYVSQYKNSSRTIYHFYFSTAPDTEILPLTLQNLKHAYTGNEKFHDMLDLYFTDLSLSSYDEAHKMYRLNYLFEKYQNL
ncbi:MAG: hypothetical protein H0X33_01775 [Taibaiella sp.]|nr:hypothetical protein [Taibaiella sp.]